MHHFEEPRHRHHDARTLSNLLTARAADCRNLCRPCLVSRQLHRPVAALSYRFLELSSRLAVHVACPSNDRPTSRSLVWIPRSRFPLPHNAPSIPRLLHTTASLPSATPEAAMSTLSTVAVGNGALQQTPASPAATATANDNDNMGSIPRRSMRGKHAKHR